MFTSLLRLIQLPLALVVMFYEWGWQTLSAVFNWLAKRRFWAWLEAQVRRAPPYLALLLFLLPSLALFPVKLGAVWLVTHGQKMLGVALLGIAKVVGTAVVARLFSLTQPALMRLTWFARFYNWFKPWKDGWMTLLRASMPWRMARIVGRRIKMRLALVRQWLKGLLRRGS
jgi:hypothetical protein